METIISSARHRALQLRTARKGGFTAAARRTFLDALAATCNVTLAARAAGFPVRTCRSEEHTSELQSLMRNSYAGFCLKKKPHTSKQQHLCYRTQALTTYY